MGYRCEGMDEAIVTDIAERTEPINICVFDDDLAISPEPLSGALGGSNLITTLIPNLVSNLM